jgi:hypothetical protein
MHTVAFSTVRSFTLLSGATISWSDSIAPATWGIQAFAVLARSLRSGGKEQSLPIRRRWRSRPAGRRTPTRSAIRATSSIRRTRLTMLTQRARWRCRAGAADLALIATPALIIGRFNQPTVSLLHVWRQHLHTGRTIRLFKTHGAAVGFCAGQRRRMAFPTRTCAGSATARSISRDSSQSAVRCFPISTSRLMNSAPMILAAGTALATVQGYEHTIWAALRSGGVPKVYRTTLIPRVSLGSSLTARRWLVQTAVSRVHQRRIARSVQHRAR